MAWVNDPNNPGQQYDDSKGYTFDPESGGYSPGIWQAAPPPNTDRNLSTGGVFTVADEAVSKIAQNDRISAADLAQKDRTMFASASASAGQTAATLAGQQMQREIAQMQENGLMTRAQAKNALDWATTQATVAGSLAMHWMDNEIQRLTANATNRLAVMKLLGDLRGPRNAFQQQAVMHGLNAAGLSRAVDSLSGGATPSFQAPQAAPQPVTLQSFLDDTGAMLPGEIQPVAQPQVPGIPPAFLGAFTPGAPAPVAQMPGAFQAGGMSLQDAISQGRQRLASFGWNGSDADFINKVKTDPTLFTGNDPIRQAVQQFG